MIETMTVNKEKMYQAVSQDYSNATDLADYLVNKGLPFRQAHEIIGKIVLYAIEKNKYLLDLTFKEYKQFCDLFEEDIYAVLTPKHVVEARNSYGGTAFSQVELQLKLAESKLKD